MLEKLISRVIEYADNKKHERMLDKFGGTQTCPYCLQFVQSGDGPTIYDHPNDPLVDVIECGGCKGESIWRFELGFFYVGPYKAPEAKHKTWSYNEALHAHQPNIGRS